MFTDVSILSLKTQLLHFLNFQTPDIQTPSCPNIKADGWILRRPRIYQIYFNKSWQTVGWAKRIILFGIISFSSTSTFCCVRWKGPPTHFDKLLPFCTICIILLVSKFKFDDFVFFQCLEKVGRVHLFITLYSKDIYSYITARIVYINILSGK